MKDSPLLAKDRVQELFSAKYGHTPSVTARSPGRVNLIGEHTDYNDGFVLPLPSIAPSGSSSLPDRMR